MVKLRGVDKLKSDFNASELSRDHRLVIFLRDYEDISRIEIRTKSKPVKIIPLDSLNAMKRKILGI